MARPGLLKHRKFIRLSRLLRSRYRAFGVLGLLWEAAYESGEPVVGDETDIEAVCDWDGEPGELVEALQSCGGAGPGFIIAHEDGRFEIHDFWTHAPEYVRKRAAREAARQKKGLTISQIRSAAGRLGAAARNSKRSANVRPFARTHSTHLTNYSSDTGLPDPTADERAPRRSPAQQSEVVAVFKRESPNFSATATTTTKSRSANFEGTEDQLDFMRMYNDLRAEIPGMSQEALTEELAPKLQELLDYASRKRDDYGQVLTKMVTSFLRSKMHSKRLKTLLNEEVWMARFDTACADVTAELDELRTAARKQRYR